MYTNLIIPTFFALSGILSVMWAVKLYKDPEPFKSFELPGGVWKGAVAMVAGLIRNSVQTVSMPVTLACCFTVLAITTLLYMIFPDSGVLVIASAASLTFIWSIASIILIVIGLIKAKKLIHNRHVKKPSFVQIITACVCQPEFLNGLVFLVISSVWTMFLFKPF